MVGGGCANPAQTHVATNYRALSRPFPSSSSSSSPPRVATLPSNYLTGASRIVNCGRINRIGESHLSRRAVTKTSAEGRRRVRLSWRGSIASSGRIAFIVPSWSDSLLTGATGFYGGGSSGTSTRCTNVLRLSTNVSTETNRPSMQHRSTYNNSAREFSTRI